MALRIPRILIAIVLAMGVLEGTYFICLSAAKYGTMVVRDDDEAKQAASKAKSENGPVALFSLDEVFANVPSKDHQRAVGIKLEVELFSEESRGMVEKYQGGIKNAIIEAAQDQTYDRLNTIAGKLYFKEALVAKINGFFQRAVVRDLHFSSFYLQ